MCILGPATRFDLKDYVVRILDTAGKGLTLVNNRDFRILYITLVLQEKVFISGLLYR